jgi:hypothetical protein
VPTKGFDAKFIGLNFKTIVVCVNERFLDKSFVGRVMVKLYQWFTKMSMYVAKTENFTLLLLMAHF